MFMALAKITFLFLLINLLVFINPADSKCPKSFDCGDLGALEFPFSHFTDPECGIFMVSDCDSVPQMQAEAGGRWYEILAKVSANSFYIRDTDIERLLNAKNCYTFHDPFLPASPHSSFIVSPNASFITCWSEPNFPEFKPWRKLDCAPFTLFYSNSTNAVPFRHADLPLQCSLSRMAVDLNRNSSELFELATSEYNLEWYVSEDCSDCHKGGGQCAINTRNQFLCKRGNTMFRIKILIGMTAAVVASIFVILILFIRRKHGLLRLFAFDNPKWRNEKDIEFFLKNNGNLTPKRYKYSDIKKMTNSLRKSLGKGGYGSVYQGKLPNGHPVAVKMLDESKGNGDDFMNEVASISRTSHVNIVSLLGFCSEGCKRALIYEFMPNGSLEKFISSTATEGGLGWQKLFEIALGIARGLDYLHQGCKTRILHFDIKPHNILLDNDFNPKISDFGLARLCPNRSSIVSMMGARGTIGYIAPEVFCRNFGEVSHKSDVYSYGMMVLEIAGGTNIDRADVDRMSETYFPDYIYKQLEMDWNGDGDGDDTLVETMNEEYKSRIAKRKLIIVGLWCIQTDPKNRPSMSKVVEMLEGKLETLHVPPKPILFSPPRSAPTFSTSGSL